MATTTSKMGLTLPGVNDAADIAVLNNNFQKIESQAMISQTTQIDDWNSAIYNGFYCSAASCINGPIASAQYHGMMINYSSVLGNQFVFKTWATGSEMWTRRYYNGAFEPWECLNPPMALGVEYRTTEKWNGKAVYTKLVDLGLSASGSMNIYHNELGATNMVRISTVMVNSAGKGEVLPVFYNNSFTGNYSVFVSACDTSHIMITVNEGMVGRRIYVTYWYTKD